MRKALKIIGGVILAIIVVLFIISCVIELPWWKVIGIW